MFTSLVYVPPPVLAKEQIPLPGKSGIVEKYFRQPPVPLRPPFQETGPEIIIDDSRTLTDPGSGPAVFVKRIDLKGNTIFDDQTLAPMIDVGQGAELTLGILSIMAHEITAYYASHGFFLARAYLPKQEIVNGEVLMYVSEGELGKILVVGNKVVKSKDLVRRLKKIKKAEILKEQTLERVLMELNELMGVKVRTILRPGELHGTSDLILEVTETLPLTLSFDADNFGSRFTGRNRFGISASAGNLVTLGDQFFLRGVKSDKDQSFILTSYLFPFTNRGTTLKISYTYSEQTLGESLSALNAGGNSNAIKAEVNQPLYPSKIFRLNIRAGVDLRKFKNFVLSETTSDDELVDIYLGLGGNVTDRYLGRTFFDFTLSHGFTETDPNQELNSRAEGRGNILVAGLNTTRYQGTGFMNSYFIMKFSGQVTGSRALSPYLFSIGGMGTVRGFPLSEHSGDNGYFASMEYVFPFPSKFPIGIENLTLNQVFSFTGFMDYGQVFVRNKQEGEKDESITGGGGGIQINLPKMKKWFPAITFGAGYAVPIQGPDPSDGSYGTWYLNGLLNYTF